MSFRQQDSQLNSLTRFARALRLATYDKQKELEHDSTVRLYCDADVAVNMILGFRQFLNGRSNDRQLLVRALLSSGYLGTAHLLRPHALELNEFFRRRAAFMHVRRKGSYRREVEEFLEAQGAYEDFDCLRSAIENVREDQRLGVFLETLKRVGSSSFIAIELANGPWQGRLVRFARERILNFEEMGPQMRDILHADRAETMRLAHLIAEQRSLGVHGRAKPRLVDVRDAAAVVSLARILRGDYAESQPLVRFYTETEALKKCWKTHRFVRQLLSSPENSSKDLSDERFFCARDADYFILRTLFPSLCFPAVRRTSKAESASYEELLLVSEELEAVVQTLDQPKGLTPERRAELLELTISGRSLRSHLDDFQSLSFLSAVWLQYEPTVAMGEFVDGLVEIWSYAKDRADDAIKQRVLEQYEEVMRKLEDSVQEIRAWQVTFLEVQKHAQDLEKRLGGLTAPDPMRDLGMVRWGVNLTSEQKDRFETVVRGLSSGEEEWWHTCAELTTALEGTVEDPGDCFDLCMVLWSLSWFGAIHKLVERFEKDVSDGEYPLELQLLATAAELMTRNLSDDSADEMISSVKARVFQMKESNRVRYLVGLGFLMYQAWFADFDGIRPLDGYRNRSERIWVERAKECFDLGAQSAASLPERSLLWSFAINQSAFVGVLTGVRHEETREFLRALASLEPHGTIWNYRFADTLGYFHFLNARRLWLKNKGARASESQTRKRVQFELKASLDYFLGDTELSYGDREIGKHKAELMMFASEIGFSLSEK